MTGWCIVPNCETRNQRNKTAKHSAFGVPKDKERLKQWEDAIPGNVKLKETHIVCGKHFDEDAIIREWIHRDSCGEIIARIAYKHPRLTDLAVPTIFGDVTERPVLDNANVKDVDKLVDSTEAPGGETLVEMEYIDCSNPDASEDPTEYEFVATFKDSDHTSVNGSNSPDHKSVAEGSAIENVSDPALPESDDKELDSRIDIAETESASSTNPVNDNSRTQRHRKSYSAIDTKKNSFEVCSTVSINQHTDSDSAAAARMANNDSTTSHSPKADSSLNVRKKMFAVVSTVASSQLHQLREKSSEKRRNYCLVDEENESPTPIHSSTKNSFTVQQRNNLSTSQDDQTTIACSLNSDELSCAIPPSWGVADLPRETGQLLVFTYTVTKSEYGIYFPITQRCVTLDADKNIEYFVYGRRVNAEETILDRILDTTESLSNILLMFQWMSICNGLGNVNPNFIPSDSSYLDYVQLWRDNDCALLSSRKRCEWCAELRRRVLTETARINGRESRRRYRKFLSPTEKQQLTELRRINRCQKRKARRAELREQKLLESLDAELKVKVESDLLDDDCSEMNELPLSIDENEV